MRNKFDPSEIPPSPALSFERSLWSNDIYYAAGIHEAGRGAWAGPLPVGVGGRQATTNPGGTMYIGVGTLVLILVIVVIVLLVRRA